MSTLSSRLSALFGFLSIFILLLPAQVVHPHNPPAQYSGLFTPAPCMFDLPQGQLEGRDVQCGYVIVPAQHNNPSGSTIELAVAIIKSAVHEPKADPLFMAQGGPGGSTIDTYAEQLLSNSRLRADRDIVLFDQRGTLYSRPALTCEEIDQLTIDYLDKDLSPEESLRLELQAMQACHQRLVEQGINLSDFDSLENAADIEALRQALGYDKINLYGVSYGTLLALHYMRLYPDSLRSVILDGIVPPQTNFILNVAQTTDRSFTRLFTTCANDPACNKTYPDLEAIFFKLVDQLDANPVTVPMTDPYTGATYNALIDGETFASGLFQMLYVSSLIPALPRMIYDAQRGEFDFFTRIMSIIIFDKSMAYGMYYSVLCAEDADFDPEQQDLSGIHPKIAEMEGRGPGEFLQVCQLWKVQPLDASVDQPVTSDIPTLILSGEFDPITPPSYGELAAASLSHSYVYNFPTGGHGQALDSDCQDGIILAFLDNPKTAPDAACIAKRTQVDFYTPRNTIDLPVIMGLVQLKSQPILQTLILLLALFILLSAVIVFPLAWLVKRLRPKPAYQASEIPVVDPFDSIPVQQPVSPRPAPFLVRIASWLAFLSGPILSVFLVGLVIAIANMFSANDNRLFFGVSGQARPLFILPLLFALLNAGMLVAAIQAWVSRAWSLGRRLFYTFLAINALVATTILAVWGALTAFI